MLWNAFFERSIQVCMHQLLYHWAEGRQGLTQAKEHGASHENSFNPSPRIRSMVHFWPVSAWTTAHGKLFLICFLWVVIVYTHDQCRLLLSKLLHTKDCVPQSKKVNCFIEALDLRDRWIRWRAWCCQLSFWFCGFTTVLRLNQRIQLFVNEDQCVIFSFNRSSSWRGPVCSWFLFRVTLNFLDFFEYGIKNTRYLFLGSNLGRLPRHLSFIASVFLFLLMPWRIIWALASASFFPSWFFNVFSWVVGITQGLRDDQRINIRLLAAIRGLLGTARSYKGSTSSSLVALSMLPSNPLVSP